ncbi:MAG: RDD family protein [Halioglobus sp.]
MSEENTGKLISGFWRRIGALLIDVVLLGFLGSMLGLVFESAFVELGGWGRVVGFAIALVYFGVMNSRISGGQTVGKRILDLRVIGSDNLPIGTRKSLVRAAILAIPFSLNGAQFSSNLIFSYLVYPLSLVVLGGIFSIGYLYLFNRLTRQSLHDLAVGSYVVNAEAPNQEVGKMWSAHLIVILVLGVLALLAPLLGNYFVERTAFKSMLKAQAAIMSVEGVSYAQMSTNTMILSKINQESTSTDYVNAQIFLTGKNINDSELASQFAHLVIANYPEATEKESLQITLSYGYDIGIWSVWYHYTHGFDPNAIN